MNDQKCRQLDDYLLGELPDEQRTNFERHLRECETCRTISQQQTIVEEQLKLVSLSIPVPAGLSTRAKQYIRLDRLRRVTLAAVCVASAACIVVAIWSLSGNFDRRADPKPHRTIAADRQEPEPDIPPHDDSPSDDIARQDPEPVVQISFTDNVLAVPVESGDPTITLIQVYPVAESLAETQ